ncbi:hypothetical protein [Nocardia sp. alder85J]|uniref:hypothetical protein n=1 Tax=Nocardia sp. alder85J TaxID=2862949 RepID=UPI001CD22847|nr:hypothetical protein [Nocardia sp. alder85J]MCX4095796.1 hypothetical protein [Nocardia sp. alder85J]
MDPTGGSICLELRVDRPVKPGLRWEIAADDRLVLRQETGHGEADVILAARVEEALGGVNVVRTERYRSPIRPTTAAEARRLPPGRTSEWALSWAHRFCDQLASGPLSPLHTGRWLLRYPSSLRPSLFRGDDLVLEYPNAHLNWNRGWSGVLPLRPLPDVDSPRVKAYRKQVREDILPPVLLWVASCLDGYVLLDGHVRLVAALAENAVAPTLVLGLGQDEDALMPLVDTIDDHWSTVLADIERTEGADSRHYRNIADTARRQIADLCVGEPMQFARTRAWPSARSDHSTG